MAWKETGIVEQRLDFVREYLSREWNMSHLCRRYGITRRTGYKWVERYEQEGLEGLRDRPRAPENCPHEYGEDMRELIIGVREKHPRWGPKKLLAWLSNKHGVIEKLPVPSTVEQWLKQEGLVISRKRRRRASPTETGLTQAERCNQVWYADHKGWFRTGDGKRCDPLTISEASSRYLLKCHGCHGQKTADAKRLFRATFEEFGLPEVIRTDNGTPFASTGFLGLSRLSVWWMKLGIVPERIQPGKPQQNGVHERMHRTLKQETQGCPEKNLRRQQKRFDEFRLEYNQERPHEALGMKVPADFFMPSPRAYPSREPVPEYGAFMTVRRVKHHGEFSWKGQCLFLSEVFAGEPIGLHQQDERYWKIYFYTIPVAILDDQHHKLIVPGTPQWRRYHSQDNNTGFIEQERR